MFSIFLKIVYYKSITKTDKKSKLLYQNLAYTQYVISPNEVVDNGLSWFRLDILLFVVATIMRISAEGF